MVMLLSTFVSFPAAGVGGNSVFLLSGDMQSGTDKILLSGDMQSGTDVVKLSGDQS